jgi:hypothetical protein
MRSRKRFTEVGRPYAGTYLNYLGRSSYDTVRKKGVPQKGGSFPVVNSDAAGIDIDSEEHWVAVPEDRDEIPVRPFGCFTSDLHAMARWLKACGVTTVAAESTGVCWIPPFQILEEYGFEVKLVNARHVKNVPGRKTDVSDCQWLEAPPHLWASLRLLPPRRSGMRPTFILEA